MRLSIPKTKTEWVASTVIVISILVSGAVLFPVFAQERGSRMSPAISMLKQNALMILMYAEDNDGRLPEADKWMDVTEAYRSHDQALIDPSIDARMPGQYGFAFFRPLSNLDIGAFSNQSNIPLVFQSSDMRWNANGDLSLLPDPPRWDGKNLIAFLDGHVKAVEGTPKVEIKMAEEPE